MKNYKIYRYAYVDEVNTITVPDETTFYLADSFHIARETEYGKVYQNTYIAIVKYSKENLNTLEMTPEHRQSYSMETFPVADKLIIIKLTDVYPLSDDFPITKELPTTGDVYIKCRAKKQINKYSSMSLPELLKEFDENHTTEMIDAIHPTVQYIKIHGFNPYQPIKLVCSQVTVGSWVDEREVLEIDKSSIYIENVLRDNVTLTIDKSSEDEYNETFEKVIEKIR